MAIFDFLVGKQGLQEQRDRAIDYAQERYDPSTLQPQVNLARERATEGISEGQESMARRRTVESLFRPTDTSIYGGNQARAIAGQQQQNRQAQQGMADFEAQLTQQDLQARQQGQQQFAEARTQQLQTEAQRDAAIEEAEMQYEQELENRRKQLGSTVANLAGTVAGSFLGPAGAAAGGALAGGLVGGGMGAVQGAGAGFSTAYSRQQSEDMINQLTGGEGSGQATQQTQGGGGGQSLGNMQQTFDFVNNLMQGQRQPQQPQAPNVPAQQPQDSIVQEDINVGMGQLSGEPMSMPQQPEMMNMVQQAQNQNFFEGMNLGDDYMQGNFREEPSGFSATGQFMGQGRLRGPSVMELLQGYFDFGGQQNQRTGYNPYR